MLITEEGILQRFLDHLSWASAIDLATAWATSHEGLRALRRQEPSPEVRAVVGRWGNMTDPFALRTLSKIGQLRGPDAGRHFHPKVIIFRNGGKSVAWVGSTNFTSGGFGMNDETVFETTDTESVQDWFNDLWDQTFPLGDDAIDAYAEARKNSLPPLAPRPQTIPGQDPLQLFERVSDWQSHVVALEQCDAWWSHRHSWSVLGEQSSWRETAEVLCDVVAQPNWDELGQFDRLRLPGLTPGEDWVLFGRMRWSALGTVFRADLAAIQDVVIGVAIAADSAFPQLAFDSYRALREIDGVGPGITTRLLTLARPDRFVSVNGASTKGLAASFGLASSTLGNPSNYTHLLTAIYNQDWYKTPAPRIAHQHTIWRIRAALLDPFVYDPEVVG